ncbi:MAG: EamA family transporter [Candidatus Micrarchaeota archaeon]|nr:EamA family transporter [Candidatus Micrarchaeota archaeon]
MLGAIEIIGITLLSAVIAASAQYLYKRGIAKFRFSLKEIINEFKKRDILLGGTLYIVSLAVYLYALDNAPLISFVYPVFASTFVFVLLISKLVFHERINLHRVAGMALIILGIAVISLTFPAV